MIVCDWCIYNPIGLDIFDLGSRYLGYETIVYGVCGLLFAAVSENTVSQFHSIFFRNIFMVRYFGLFISTNPS